MSRKIDQIMISERILELRKLAEKDSRVEEALSETLAFLGDDMPRSVESFNKLLDFFYDNQPEDKE